MTLWVKPGPRHQKPCQPRQGFWLWGDRPPGWWTSLFFTHHSYANASRTLIPEARWAGQRLATPETIITTASQSQTPV
jgi:hypothetical protein